MKKVTRLNSVPRPIVFENRKEKIRKETEALYTRHKKIKQKTKDVLKKED